jgi:hypothetical protein
MVQGLSERCAFASFSGLQKVFNAESKEIPATVPDLLHGSVMSDTTHEEMNGAEGHIEPARIWSSVSSDDDMRLEERIHLPKCKRCLNIALLSVYCSTLEELERVLHFDVQLQRSESHLS